MLADADTDVDADGDVGLRLPPSSGSDVWAVSGVEGPEGVAAVVVRLGAVIILVRGFRDVDADFDRPFTFGPTLRELVTDEAVLLRRGRER
jgi:hypothetical protein